MRRKILFFFLVVLATVLLAASLCMVTGRTVVVPIKGFTPILSTHTQGDVIAPLDQFDFSHGDWKVYLIIDPSDFDELGPAIPRRTCLYIDDVQVLGKMKQSWKFVVQNGDVATVTSSIRFYHKGELVFESGVVLSGTTPGLQQSGLGWVTPVDPAAFVKLWQSFKPVRSPIIFL